MKFIAIPNGHALAHVSRLVEVARILAGHGHDIEFAGFGAYMSLAEKNGFKTTELPYVSIEQVITSVRNNRLDLLFPYQEIKTYVDAEISFLTEKKPDFVLLDNRPSARTAADYCNIPTIACLNAHMSQYRSLGFMQTPDYLNFLLPWQIKLEQFFYNRMIMKGLNELRETLSLPRYYANQHEEGNLALLTDIPEFNPTVRLPEHVHYVGPITWKNDLPPPQCMSQLDPERKTIYFSLGSSSLQDLLEHLLPMTQQGCQIVVAYGKFDDKAENIKLPAHIYLEEYINADELLPYCDAVCCHGGNGTLYQALSFGLPVIAVSTHDEQRIGSERLQQLGLGYTFQLKTLKKQGFDILIKTLRNCLNDNELKQRCQDFSILLKQWNGAKNASDRIEHYL